MSELRTVKVIISGRVQGVGYRAWTVSEAKQRGIGGWVRNRADGTVEAVFSGSAEAVEAMLGACRRGPFLAKVNGIELLPCDDPPEANRFLSLPTA